MSNSLLETDHASRASNDPDPELPKKAKRRQYSAAYKQRILTEVAKCSEPGEVGALLRREGLYSSLLSRWRAQQEEGSLSALKPKKRGRKARPVDPQARRIVELERETAHLRKKLKNAEIIIDVQKKLSDLLATHTPESKS